MEKLEKVDRQSELSDDKAFDISTQLGNIDYTVKYIYIYIEREREREREKV